MYGFCPLASGSKGNALFFGSKEAKILIDCGISYRSLVKKLAEIDILPEMIDAILITHEHHDHIAGLQTFLSHHPIPVFANLLTAKASNRILAHHPKWKIFSSGETFSFLDLEIHPFSIPHDTEDPVAITIQSAFGKVGICTDLGFPTSVVKAHLKQCDHLVLESNHDPEMVRLSRRPISLQQRILGREGHLSNQQAAELLREIAHPDLRHVHLAHLSSECNCPEKAIQSIAAFLSLHGIDLSMTIAPQEKIGLPIHFKSRPLA